MIASMLVALLAVARPLPARILAFGDSLTAGLCSPRTGAARYAPYGVTLAQNTGSEVLSRGVVLESAHAMPSRLASTLEAEGRFDCAVILGGSNDLWRGQPDAIWTSLQSLYSQVRLQGGNEPATVGMVTLPPFEPDVMRWLAFTGVLELTDRTRLDVNERIRDEAAGAQDAFLVDLASFSHEAAMARADGLHFDECGYRRLGDEVAAALRSFCDPGSK